MPAKQVDQVSGHSVRVGATQDLLALNIDLASQVPSNYKIVFMDYDWTINSQARNSQPAEE